MLLLLLLRVNTCAIAVVLETRVLIDCAERQWNWWPCSKILNQSVRDRGFNFCLDLFFVFLFFFFFFFLSVHLVN